MFHNVPILIADAGSADGTGLAASQTAYDHHLNVTMIPGGLPAVGRNAGAKLASTPYVLFLDADVELEDPFFLSRALDRMKRLNLYCATTSIHTPTGALRSKIAYAINNFYQWGSRFFGTPFSTGMCMFFDRAEFNRLGGFNEKALFAEDYLLSKQVNWRRFRVIPGGVATSDRRFKKMGYLALAKLFFTTALLSHRESQFTKDHNYWKF